MEGTPKLRGPSEHGRHRPWLGWDPSEPRGALRPSLEQFLTQENGKVGQNTTLLSHVQGLEGMLEASCLLQPGRGAAEKVLEQKLPGALGAIR